MALKELKKSNTNGNRKAGTDKDENGVITRLYLQDVKLNKFYTP